MHAPPIFDQVHDAEDLSRAELRVWRAAVRHLDFVELRPLKLVVLEHATRLSRGSLSAALGRLVALGYLVRAERAAGGVASYRVPCSRTGPD